MQKAILILLIWNFTLSVAHTQKPNIVLIMADDIGLGDIGYYHQERTGQQPVVPTPHIDELIRQGMRFADAHSPASLCAPTRFSMMTGNFSYRNAARPWGVWKPSFNAGIEPNYTTIARLAKQGGYTTAFFGKWGLGGVWDGPPASDQQYAQMDKGARYYGFDYALELPQGIQNEPFAFYENGQWMKLKPNAQLVQISFERTKYDESNRHKKREGVGDSNWDPTLAGPILAEKAVAYLNKQAEQENPFFLYYCSQAVHIPHTPTDQLHGVKIAGTTPGKHGDMIKELDAQVGMIVDALKANGHYQNTLFVFTSDNGGLDRDQALKKAGHDSSNGFLGSKASIYEGGHRVPFIAVWPGVIEPGSTSHTTIVGHDMVATLATIAGIPIDRSKVMDSANLLPVFKQETQQPIHPYLLHQSQAKGGPYYALREGDWKLIFKTPKREQFDQMQVIGLYLLSENPYEKKMGNLAHNPAFQDKIKAMTSTYLKLRKNGGSTLD